MNRRSFIGRALAAIGLILGAKAKPRLMSMPPVTVPWRGEGDWADTIVWPDGRIKRKQPYNSTLLPADQWIGKKPKCLT